ncbi:het protein nwd2 [Fusarium austroafricanum]|uniref:Het protein nwd2 n=1 Tax=Fusarium austroafricanum TaxID=2364996 RepID=A0A8H4P9T1_9HYPO|nr:het protein nwd2 [Fusarium austroafricanum]
MKNVPLQRRINAAIEEAKGAKSPLKAFHKAWNQLADDYDCLVAEMKATLNRDLAKEGIRATVSGRVKSEDSIEKSISRRRRKGETYDSLDHIFKGIHDLAGFRIIVQYPSGISRAEELVQRFDCIGVSEFSSERDLGLSWKPIFGAYKSKNYRAKINRGEGDPLYPFREVLIEIQVLSLAESLYNTFAHPLIYKKAPGELSSKEQRIVDISHGLSLCYWICLSSMEDQLEDNQPIPRAVRKVAEGGTTQEIENDFRKLIEETPGNLTTASGTVPVEDLVQFIRRNQEQGGRSPSELSRRLGEIKGHEAKVTSHHYGQGNINHNYGTSTNNNYYGLNPNISETPKPNP